MPKAAMFNPRIETVNMSSASKDAFRTARCLIAANGLYEWTKSPAAGGNPRHIHLPDHQPFSFAGLWANNKKAR
jgi:putative SOS response-associated peptidase YedK